MRDPLSKTFKATLVGFGWGGRTGKGVFGHPFAILITTPLVDVGPTPCNLELITGEHFIHYPT